MSKFRRFLPYGSAGVLIVLLTAGGLAFTPTFQTWAARRVLASQPGIGISLGRVAAGLQQLRVDALAINYRGAELIFPSIEVHFPIIAAAIRDEVRVSRLVAKGWTLDLSKAAGHDAAIPGSANPAADAAATAVAMVFGGIFEQLKLPVDLALDGVELEGECVLSGPSGQAPVRAAVTLQGGGLAAARPGRFVFNIRLTYPDSNSPFNTLAIDGRIEVAMDTARTFTRLAALGEARAGGASLPQPVQLTAEVSAARVAGGEDYTLSVQSDGKRLVDLQANFPANSARLGGAWKLDLRDTDVAPFALGRPLPTFEAMGSGMFETDTGFKVIHAAGRLQSSASRLADLRMELGAVGELNLFGDFDLTLADHTVRVDRLMLDVNAAKPVLAVQSLQAFEFDPGSGELKVANPASDLLVIKLHGVPVGWLAPFVQPYVPTGGALRGELAAGAAGGGLVVRSITPLMVEGMALADGSRPLLENVDLALNFAADYSPLGWQVDLSELRAGSGTATLLSFAAKAGRIAGKDQSTKVTGRWSANLPALLQQPFAKDAASLTGGRVEGMFAGKMGAQQEVEASLVLDELAISTGQALPVISASLRVDVAGDGKMAFNLPIVFLDKAKARRSDVGLTGTAQMGPQGLQFDAKVTSEEIFIEDVQILAALADSSAAVTNASPTAGEQPAWHGVTGRLTMALKKLHYSDQFEVSDVQGSVRVDRSGVKVEEMRAGLGEGASAAAKGDLTFDAASVTPYALQTDLIVKDFNPKPLFLARNPGQPASVDGKFSVTSKLAGQGATLAELGTATQGDFQLTSRGGVFHGLPVSVAIKVESTGRIAAGVAAVGSVLASVTGKKEFADIAGKAQAVAELSKTLATISYDQLSVAVTRQDSLDTVLHDFALISPELRLTGGGRAGTHPGISFLDSPVALEFKLRARGKTAHLLKYLGALEGEPDELGYTACNLPLRISGTLSSPDTSELNRALTNLAVEHSGAGELLNRLLGGG